MSNLSADTDLRVAVLESLPIAVLVADTRGTVVSVNAALTALTRRTSAELVGKPAAALWPGAPTFDFPGILQRAIRLREPWRGECFCRSRDGEPLSVEQTVTPVQGPDGEVVHVAITLQEITGRKRMEGELRLANERLEITQQAALTGTWDWNCATGAMEGSSGWLKLHGFDRAGTVPTVEAWWSVLHPDDRIAAVSRIDEGIRRREPDVSTEYRVVLPDGQIRWIGTWGHASYDDRGEAVRVTGVAMDISGRKRAEGSMAEAQRDFERFFTLIPELACIASTDGYFKKVNPAWERTLGYTETEVLTTPFLEFVHPEDRERTLSEIARQSREYRTNHFINRYRCKNGSYRLLEWTTTFNRDESTRFGVARDITEQRMSEEALRESEERFRIMADSCPTIIWVTDAEGRTRLANRMCAEFFGATFEQMDGDESRLLIHPEEQAEYARLFRQAVREQAPFRAEARVRRADGEWRWIVSYAEPRLSLSGEFLGHVGISPDITDRKQTEVALQRAKDAAESANRSKSEFLANMSHEIRTPMNAVIGLTDLTLDTELTPEQRGYLEGVKNSADSLLRILNDILDFSKIEAGKLEFEVIDFDLRRTVETTLKGLGVRAAAKKLELACYVGPGVPARALGDPGRLRQILVNLIGNAIKFTEQGEVVIGVERLSETAETCELHFSVTDTGIGIHADKQQDVFRAFAQADSSSTRRFGGTGLGLTISSQLVEMMGGRIWVESEEGKGSTFHFTVNFRFSAEGAEGEIFPPDPGCLEGLAVLVVDDNDTNRHILGKMLSAWGLKTTLAGSGPAALAALRQAAEAGSPFPLAILDVHMPGMDGFTLARQMKADPLLKGANIVLLTSGVQRGDAARCTEIGVNAHMAKPVGEIELLDAIRGMAQRTARTEGRPTPRPRQPVESRNTRLRLLVVEDNPVNRLLATRLLEKHDHVVTAAANGQEALETMERSRFDCVLMDVQMPVMDGFEATAAIRQRERVSGGHLPIIAMTAHAMAGDLERCLAAGMDGYISKPIKAKDLQATVEQVLRALNPVSRNA